VAGPENLPPGAPVVLILHGLGTNANDLLPLCEELHLPPCRYVLPDAPLHLPGYDQGAYAWYDFQTNDRKQIEDSRDYLFKVMDSFAKDPNGGAALGGKEGARPLILVGFSEGGVMALEAGLNYKGEIAAIVSMSGYIPDPSATLTDAKAPFGTPILLIHGIKDGVVPVEGSRHATQLLKRKGYKPILRLFPMTHTITTESLGEASKFIQGVLAKYR
jgi:phospholipase/carboxylesterase